MKSFNPRPPGLSLFELALGRGGQNFLTAVFNHWPPDLIFRLYSLNYNIHHLVRFYVRGAWDPVKSLSRWFDNPERFLTILRNTNALVCGAVALKYFDRDHTVTKNIDICIKLDGIRELGQILIAEKYTFCPDTGDSKNFDTTVLLQSSRTVKINQDSDSSTVRKVDPYQRPFSFIRCAPLLDGKTDTMTVTVHQVNWEPLRYILCMESTALVNVLTGQGAVSVFPRHTFLLRINIDAAQGHETTNKVTASWLAAYSVDGFQRIRGGHNILGTLTTGRRYLGDNICWVVPFERFNKAYGVPCAPIHGPPFEVLDWKTGTPRQGAYLRLADPFVWSSWAFMKGYIGSLQI